MRFQDIFREPEKKEKKVEYVELIYDLIFVYMVGKNNSLLQDFSGGFVNPRTFLNYILCTFAVIQMWALTAYYINVFGRHSVRDHVMMFVNMFLLYFMGEGTQSEWQRFHTQYHIAWALLLLNIALQYLIELRHRENSPELLLHASRMAAIISAEAALVLASVLELRLFGTSFLSVAAVAGSILFLSFGGGGTGAEMVDFPHLSERVMLYVVFTFGEMIIGCASYFEGELTRRSLYFSSMAFLIVVGLFLSYGILYDHLIDREMNAGGVGYINVHIFLIFALNNITTALEFMRSPEVDLWAKMLFITLSLILYCACLIACGAWAKPGRKPSPRFILYSALAAALFLILMMLLRDLMMLNIALTVLAVFLVFAALFGFSRHMDRKDRSSGDNPELFS